MGFSPSDSKVLLQDWFALMHRLVMRSSDSEKLIDFCRPTSFVAYVGNWSLNERLTVLLSSRLSFNL